MRPTDGLSNREYFASLALQGLLTGAGDNDFSYDDAAEDAVTYADALIAALNKKAGTS
ncbi:hypothetical protein [Deinococcus hopiensis]|uniref:hypothetical protein n=1 Tax=Deinococcus hopiensis TaxID=309885 RepID=UPI001482B45B|nr:hypothetical protein [Deinococcus hopiensis]